MTVPGVNLICAATFIAAVGHARRFLTSRKLVASAASRHLQRHPI
jgi:transposase